MFNKFAGSYQEKYMDVGLYEKSLLKFLAKLPDDARILDVGCGPGNISAYLRQQKPQLQVLGIDAAENMIELARKNIPQAEFRVMDIREIEKIKQSFDAVVCGFCLPYLSEKETVKLIHTSASLLNKNGIIYLSTMEGDYSLSGYQPSSSGEEKLFIHFYKSTQLQKILNDAGFNLISEEIITQPADQKSSGHDIILIATIQNH